MRKNAASVSALALALAQDKRFRKRVLSALAHGTEAGRRTRRELGARGAIARLAADETLLKELGSTQDDLKRAYGRLQAKRRSHKLRNVLVVAAVAAVAGVPKLREQLLAAFSKLFKQLRVPGVADSPARSSSGDSERPSRLEDLTREELYARAQEADIPGRSEMSKERLIEELRARR